jgi:hypothetical protein
MNYRFNLDDWLPRFPLDPDAEVYSGQIITGPCDICHNEWLRREVQDQFEWGEGVPVDIFVMAEGEPEHRHATKVGGLPYRPAAAKWPKTEQGQPMNFIAQFNFCDSKDLTGDLPGDLLLVFADSANGLFESLAFEWQPLGLDDLLDDLPPNPDLNACYGLIYRTVSFPGAKRVGEQKYPICRGKEVRSEYFLRKHQAMQIGTEPFFIQGDPELPGRPICTISSIQPDQHSPYAWINHPEPLLPEDEWNYDTNDLMIGDMGCVYISIDRKQRLHWSADCY